MRDFSLILISLIVATGIMVTSYYFFQAMDHRDTSSFSNLMALPFGFASAFAFGSGTTSMWIILILEVGTFTIIIYSVIKIFKRIMNSNGLK